MRVRILGLGIAAGLAGICAAGATMAAPCYVIFDRDDAVIYRDVVPPFDLSTAGAPQRAVLRQRGQLLLVAEFERCNVLGWYSPKTGGTNATVDEIVAQLRPAIATSNPDSSGSYGSSGITGISGSPGITGISGSSVGSSGSSVAPAASGSTGGMRAAPARY